MQASACNFTEKETFTAVFSREFCEISKNTFFTEHLRATASERFTGRHNYKVLHVYFVLSKLLSKLLHEEETKIKSYLLQSAKNNVLENNSFTRHKNNHTQCISRVFFCQILLCSSIQNVSSCAVILVDAMADC